MSKTINFHVTFYSPKELWRMFWNWTFWPRRKQCSEWIEFLEGSLSNDVADILFEYKISGIIVSDKDADELYDKLKAKITEHCDKTKELMCMPL